MTTLLYIICIIPLSSWLIFVNVIKQILIPSFVLYVLYIDTCLRIKRKMIRIYDSSLLASPPTVKFVNTMLDNHRMLMWRHKSSPRERAWFLIHYNILWIIPCTLSFWICTNSIISKWQIKCRIHNYFVNQLMYACYIKFNK